MKRGTLIVLEGISGTGKETQAKLLQEYLIKQGIDAIIVYHPSIDLKSIFSRWRNERDIDHITELYLLLADRYDHVRRVINPALKKGQWVISLRSWLSALIYQGKSQKDRVWIADEFGRFEQIPDYLFYFDIDPVVAYDRAMARYKQTGEPMGKFETKELLSDMRSRYKKVMKTLPHKAINASLSIDDIHREIVKFLPPA